jgi:hypothetical protein
MSPNTLDQIPQTDRRVNPEIGCDAFRFVQDEYAQIESMSPCYSPSSCFLVGYKPTWPCAGNGVKFVSKLIDTMHTMNEISDLPSYVDKAMVALFITYSEEKRNSLVVDFVRNASRANPITRSMFPHVTNVLD